MMKVLASAGGRQGAAGSSPQCLQAFLINLHRATHMPAALYAYEICLMTDGIMRLWQSRNLFQVP